MERSTIPKKAKQKGSFSLPQLEGLIHISNGKTLRVCALCCDAIEVIKLAITGPLSPVTTAFFKYQAACLF